MGRAGAAGGRADRARGRVRGDAAACPGRPSRGVPGHARVGEGLRQGAGLGAGGERERRRAALPGRAVERHGILDRPRADDGSAFRGPRGGGRRGARARPPEPRRGARRASAVAFDAAAGRCICLRLRAVGPGLDGSLDGACGVAREADPDPAPTPGRGARPCPGCASRPWAASRLRCAGRRRPRTPPPRRPCQTLRRSRVPRDWRRRRAARPPPPARAATPARRRPPLGQGPARPDAAAGHAGWRRTPVRRTPERRRPPRAPPT